MGIVPGLIGAGIGAVGSLLGPKEQTTTQTTQLDPRTQQHLNRWRQLAGEQYRGAQSFTPGMTDLQGRFGDLAGNLAFGSQVGLGGIEEYFNPYQEEVIGGVQAGFDRQRLLNRERAAEQATRAGAFGGSRSAVLEAQGARGIGMNEMQQIGQMRHAGFGAAAGMLGADRMRAMNLGLTGLQGLQGLEQFQNMRQQQAMQGFGAAMGPYQGTTSGTQPLYSNPLLGAAGGFATGMGLFPGSEPTQQVQPQVNPYAVNQMAGPRYGFWGF
jgi:hypothetical protein